LPYQISFSTEETVLEKEISALKEKFPSSILVLPAESGLPFRFEIPFNDDLKIEKILSQQVADTYPLVNESWCFSWKKKQLEGGAWVISGLAFPQEFSPEKILPGIGWRHAVPDIYLAATEAAGVYRLKTPVSSALVIIDQDGSNRRIITTVADSVLPMLLKREGFEGAVEIDLSAKPSIFFTGIESLLKQNEKLDISDWRQNEKNEKQRFLIASFFTLILGGIFIWHAFLYLECRLYESAAKRTGASIEQSFGELFPAVPAVDPINQIERSIKELNKKLSFLSRANDDSLLKFLSLLGSEEFIGISFKNISVDENGFSILGKTQSYSAMEKLKGIFEQLVEKKAVKVVRTLQTAQGIEFVLEGKWAE
jgi:hypothetical protein